MLAGITHGTLARTLSCADSETSDDVAPQASAYSDVSMMSLGAKRPMHSSHAAGRNAKRVRSAGEEASEVVRTSALWHALPRALPLAEALGALPVVALPASQRAASVDSVLPEAACAERAQSVAAAPERASALGTIVDMVEGQAVRVEERGIEGTLG